MNSVTGPFCTQAAKIGFSIRLPDVRFWNVSAHQFIREPQTRNHIIQRPEKDFVCGKM